MSKKTPIYAVTILLILLSLAYVIPHIINGIIDDPGKVATPKKEEIPENHTISEIPELESNRNSDINKSSLNNKDNILLKVDGKNIVDKDGNIVKLSGFFIWTSDILYNSEELENNLNKIQSSGFNTILLAISWSYHIEPYEKSPGIYDKEKISLFEETIQKAQEKGLYVIFSMRLSSSDSTSKSDDFGGWAYADMFSPHYTDEWKEYFERYLKAWEYMIRRLDKYESVIGYNLWFYPFHGIDPEYENWIQPTHKIDHYEQTLTPMFLDTLRKNSEKIYFWTPVEQGSMATPEINRVNNIGNELGELMNDPTSSTGQYMPGFDRISITHNQYVNRELVPIDDTNVVYCAEGHRPINVERLEQPPFSWTGTEYQKMFIDACFKPLWLFTEKYQVPGMITEMGMFNEPEGAEQWRIDAYDYKMQRLNDYEIHWLYMWNGREKPADTEGNWNNVGEMLIRNIP